MAAIIARKSFFGQLSNANATSLWLIRVPIAIVLLTLGTAMWLVKAGQWHDFLLGLAFGILLGVFFVACNTRATESGPLHQPSDVENLRVTPV